MSKSILRVFILMLAGFVTSAFDGSPAIRAQNLTLQDIEKLPVPPADHRVEYGSDAQQFGELRLPAGKGPHPVAVIIHGGCWYSEYDIRHVGSFAAALTKAGFATWALEYRRTGNAGGGWPGTFEDVGRGTDYLRVLARRHPLDLKRVVAVGHSAGGQLALWLAARPRLPKSSPLYGPKPLPLRGVVALAGITDMKAFRPRCGDAVTKLLGGPPEEQPERYRQTSPVELLPLGVRQWLIHGGRDQIVPAGQSKEYVVAARRKGDSVKLLVLDEAGHFDLIAPRSSAWPAVEGAVRALLNKRGTQRR
jgi:acetyl esterase/lipase